MTRRVRTIPSVPLIEGAPVVDDLYMVASLRRTHLQGKTLPRDGVSHLFDIIEQQRLSLVWASRKLRDADTTIKALEKLE